jgi:hypothetical protein
MNRNVLHKDLLSADPEQIERMNRFCGSEEWQVPIPLNPSTCSDAIRPLVPAHSVQPFQCKSSS